MRIEGGKSVKARWLGTPSLLVLLAAMPALAQVEPADTSAPVLLTAEQVIHDKERNVVTAVGHVEVAQNQRILLADKVVYDLNADRIVASGDVSLLEPTGEVLFADEAEVTGDLKNAIARDIMLLLTDQSRMAAAVGRRIDGEVMELERAVYSSCQPCAEDPGRPLLWQIKALHVTHDQATKDIEYEDAWLEFLGLPVAYTPYLSHPDPTVKRRSGFLAPTLSQTDSLGTSVTAPYYYVISPHQDLTISPRITTAEGPVLGIEHRKRFSFGEMATSGTGTVDSHGEVRGHLFAEGTFEIDDVWRTGYDLERSSDETYLRRYDYARSNKPYLTSRAFVEGFGARSYALAESYAFQDQTAGGVEGVPYVAPLLQYSYLSSPNALGGYIGLDANFLSLVRGGGTDTRRLSVRPSFVLPWTGSWGGVYTFTAAAQGDVYQFDRGSAQGGDSKTDGRLMPELALEWRHPFVRTDSLASHVIEPIVLGVLSPHWDDDDLPNEDSLEFEFNDTNIFRLNRYTGFDRVETGPRVSYGLRYGFFGHGGSTFNVMLGQSYLMKQDDSAPTGSGLDDNFSDVVGRVSASMSENLDVYYRFRLDKTNFSPLRHEITSLLGPPALRLGVDYAVVEGTGSLGEISEREGVAFSLRSRISRNWSASTFARFNLADGTDLVKTGFSIAYDDECFTAVTSVSNDRTRDRDVEEGYSGMLRVVFKPLGELPLGIF